MSASGGVQVAKIETANDSESNSTACRTQHSEAETAFRKE